MGGGPRLRVPDHSGAVERHVVVGGMPALQGAPAAARGGCVLPDPVDGAAGARRTGSASGPGRERLASRAGRLRRLCSPSRVTRDPPLGRPTAIGYRVGLRRHLLSGAGGGSGGEQRAAAHGRVLDGRPAFFLRCSRIGDGRDGGAGPFEFKRIVDGAAHGNRPRIDGQRQFRWTRGAGLHGHGGAGGIPRSGRCVGLGGRCACVRPGGRCRQPRRSGGAGPPESLALGRGLAVVAERRGGGRHLRGNGSGRGRVTGIGGFALLRRLGLLLLGTTGILGAHEASFYPASCGPR